MLVACLADMRPLLAGRRRIRLAGSVPRCLLMLCPARGHAVRALARVFGLRCARDIVCRRSLCYAARFLLLLGPAAAIIAQQPAVKPDGPASSCVQYRQLSSFLKHDRRPRLSKHEAQSRGCMHCSGEGDEVGIAGLEGRAYVWPLEVPSNHMRGSGASSSDSSAHCSLRDAELLCVSALLCPRGDSWTPADKHRAQVTQA